MKYVDDILPVNWSINHTLLGSIFTAEPKRFSNL